ncbi:hypothetical protein GH810_06050 [Acetobacterium paludosum]|uniref:Uncharacterized protein n=1 Tax=Acetobacterium paludosum TaxID=52693 RepID=A0A923KWB2_9FIRM|nr:hypothetical protein [Acetobacterium paludosum]MBC3887868.1 hypothetical protein [Acetobacterium paludosum]
MMFNDFSKFNFEVIDVTITGAPEMVINMNGITFSAKLLEILGNPDYVRPLVDAPKKAFAIQVCKETDGKSMRLRKNNHSGSYSSSCSAVRHTLRHLMKGIWKDTMRYRISGTSFPEDKAVVFDLSKADELPPFHSGKKKISKL